MVDFTIEFDENGKAERATNSRGDEIHEGGPGGQPGPDPGPYTWTQNIVIHRKDASPGCYWIRLGNQWYCLPTP